MLYYYFDIKIEEKSSSWWELIVLVLFGPIDRIKEINFKKGYDSGDEDMIRICFKRIGLIFSLALSPFHFSCRFRLMHTH